MVVKISFQNKSYGSTRRQKTSAITGDLFVKFIISNSTIKVAGAQMILHAGTEFNEHQQKTFTTTSGLRAKFARCYSINFTNPIKKLHKMNHDELQWWNQQLKKFGSLLTISKYLTGNNPTGAQKDKSHAEFILINSIYEPRPFFNLLRTFTNKGQLKALDFNYNDHIDFDAFLNLVAQISHEHQFVISHFYNDDFKYFYVREMMEYLGHDYETDQVQKFRNEFRNNLIGFYDRIDQFYRIFKSRRMVEAAHIKPVKDITAIHDIEIKDINNGLLLSPDIHKLFDSGALTFDAQSGQALYTTNAMEEPFNITTNEAQRLALDSYSLDKKLLTEARVKYLEYHNKHVFQKGV